MTPTTNKENPDIMFIILVVACIIIVGYYFIESTGTITTVFHAPQCNLTHVPDCFGWRMVQ